MNNEPKKHHYIPQFIIKNFCNDKGQIYYWNINKNVLEKRNTTSVFMNLNMYRDEKNNFNNPVLIENDLSIYENEIANIFKSKILYNETIILTRSEMEKLRIFLTLLSFRSDSRMKQYKTHQLDEKTKEILLAYQHDGDFESLWKRELLTIANLRSIREIDESKIIDPIIKQEFKNDLNGFYMTFVDARGGDFILTDVYPTLEIYPVESGINIHLHCIYPVSNSRAILLNHIMFKDKSDLLFGDMKAHSLIKDKMVLEPECNYKVSLQHSLDDEFFYKPQKIYEKDVKYINALLLNEARVGVVFTNENRVLNSICNYDYLKEKKSDYSSLENEIRILLGH